jgi:hypothetical protein
LIQFFHQKNIAHNLFIARAPHLSMLEKIREKQRLKRKQRSLVDGEQQRTNHCAEEDADKEASLASASIRANDEKQDNFNELPELDEEDEALLRQAPLYVTVYMFPRKAVFGAKPTMNFTPAACECAGHLLIYSKFMFFSSFKLNKYIASHYCTIGSLRGGPGAI